MEETWQITIWIISGGYSKRTGAAFYFYSLPLAKETAPPSQMAPANKKSQKIHKGMKNQGKPALFNLLDDMTKELWLHS